jgi:2,5-diketo-D-gluconate reductase A
MVPTLTMNDGRTIPQLGYGVFQVPPPEAQTCVTAALAAGYTLIDTAAAYQNEDGVGAAITGRKDLFITTKLWNSAQGYDATLKAFDRSMQLLGLDVLDLYLIHWPTPARNLYVETWKAFEHLLSEGRIASIGVSNFTPLHLDRLAQECQVVPVINQIELHPRLSQSELRAYHATHGILTEAWSPIGQGKGLLDDPTITTLAAEVGRTPAQVVLRWHVQLGNVVIPKTVTPARMAENIDVFDFELSPAQVAVLDGLDQGQRIGPDPELFELA